MSASDNEGLLEGVAIVGMACRFPGANDIESFWRNLCDGVESITFFSDEELDRLAVDPAESSDPKYVSARGIIDGVEEFDAGFFGFTRKEAEITDPQHRLFLECCAEALEHAGCDAYGRAVSVYGGAGANMYLMNHLANSGYLRDGGNLLQALLHNKNDHMVTRVAYKLNLKGPSAAVQTACSTSLVAVSMACQALLSYQTDAALAGGATIMVPQNIGYLYNDAGIMSPDGHCRAFDATAKGTVSGNGVGVVVLKRYQDAVEVGDTIWAVIRGSAINNDGALKAGYTAPSVDSQAEVIALAQGVADVSPDSVTYIEAHGTGTTLGDPIEFEALTKAFRLGTQRKGFCALGSVKTAVGHLDTASGVAGLIKTALMLHHKMIPPSLHFEAPNPSIDMPSSPFYVSNRLQPWRPGHTPRRAGVSSFGLGGANVHVVLEEAPAAAESGPSRSAQLLVLSARTAPALEAASSKVAEFLKKNPSINLADVAHTLRVGRRAYEHRRMVVCSDVSDAITALESLNPQRVATQLHESGHRPLAFMFPGQGSQYVNMARGLYDEEPVFKAQVDSCVELLKPLLGVDLREVIFAEDGQDERLNETLYTQPALFVIEYALAKLLAEWSITPDVMIGHSVGEYVAACLAGVFTLEDALRLISARARLIQALPRGSMLAVSSSETRVRELMGPDLSLAAVNGPGQCVVSGDSAAIARLETKLSGEGVECRGLNTSHAFHSAMMEPAIEPFLEEARRITFSEPRIPFISNVSGARITAAEAIDPVYWARHLRSTVRFADGLAELLDDPDAVFLEVGPGRTLRSLARWHPAKKPTQLMAPSIRHPKEQERDTAFLLNTLGRLWLAGIEPDWSSFCAGEQRRRLPLPTYQFDRQRYWVDLRPSNSVGASRGDRGRRAIEDWFYTTAWKETAPLTEGGKTASGSGTAWLVFVEGPVAEAVVEKLTHSSDQVISIRPGRDFRAVDESNFEFDPANSEDYDRLMKEVTGRGVHPNRIVHFWSLIDARDSAASSPALNNGFFSLLSLAQAFGRSGITDKTSLTVVSNGIRQVEGSDWLWPERATVLGPCLVLPREYPNLECRSIDMGIPAANTWQEEWLARQILLEANARQGDLVVAYRAGRRWIQSHEAAKLFEPSNGSSLLRQKGCYLIAGGMGGLGLEAAALLAQTVQARLILVSRTPFPGKEQWDSILAGEPEGETSGRIRRIRAMEEVGSRVLILSADVSDEQAMRRVVARARDEFGRLNGVIHAAGIPGGGVIQLKSREAVESILAPKITGARVLERVLEDSPPDFLVLFSSLSSVIGRFGQVDYTAANAFLDAFASYYRKKTGALAFSINWCAWEEVGMAASRLAGLNGRPRQAPPVDHPLLERSEIGEDGREVYITEFSPEKHWVLDEHRIVGHPVIPGVAYFEMVRAAIGDRANGRMLEFNDVFFTALLKVDVKHKREVRLELEKDGEEFKFTVRSPAEGSNGTSESLEVYAIGRVKLIAPEAPSWYDIASIRQRCNLKEIHLSEEERDDNLGPRWQSARQVYLGTNELLVPLEIPEIFSSDFELFKFHPALLDRTTGLAKKFLTTGPYLPFTYKKLRIKGDTPRRIYGYARYKADESPGKETINFDIRLLDERGLGLIEVDGFGQKQVNDPTDEIRTKGQLAVGRQRIAAAASSSAHPAAAGSGDASLEMMGSIRPTEGVEALRRILSQRSMAQIIVAARDLGQMIEEAGRAADKRELDAIRRVRTPAKVNGAARGADTPYLPPVSKTERAIARIWQEVLGAEQVGIHDNFFELGGDSLSAIQVLSSLGKEFDVEIPPAMIFEGATVGGLAKLLTKDQDEKADFDERQSRGERRKARARDRRKAAEGPGLVN